MDSEELTHFLRKKMSMQHVYQPVLIRALLQADGAASVRDVARAILGLDESQIRYYERRVRDMPTRVLQRHGVVERSGDRIELCVQYMSAGDREELISICDAKIEEYLDENGLGVWEGRYLSEPVPGNIRFEVLRRAGKRCELCGVAEGDSRYEDRLPLHVDHIVPRSKGGSNEIENLQVLCRACNIGKGNRDDTDFRSSPSDH